MSLHVRTGEFFKMSVRSASVRKVDIFQILHRPFESCSSLFLAGVIDAFRYSAILDLDRLYWF